MKKLFCIFALVVLLFTSLTGCGIEPAPKIKEGRFNLSINYEEWGDVKNVSGVFVCKYAGRSFSLEGGDFTRDWEGSVEGVENLHDTFFATVRVGETNDGGEILLNLGVFAAHFMGEPDFADSVIEPSLYIAYSSEDNLSCETSDDPEVIQGVYGLKIIDYHYDKPIKNSFGK